MWIILLIKFGIICWYCYACFFFMFTYVNTFLIDVCYYYDDNIMDYFDIMNDFFCLLHFCYEMIVEFIVNNDDVFWCDELLNCSCDDFNWCDDVIMYVDFDYRIIFVINYWMIGLYFMIIDVVVSYILD